MNSQNENHAVQKIMEYQSRRDHSEWELRRKLGRFYSQEEIEQALKMASDQDLLANPSDLAERTSRVLHERKKGYLFIRNYLKEKGLTLPQRNEDLEIEKAVDIVIRKFHKRAPFSYKEQTQVYRLLHNRGFDEETIRKVIHEGI